MANLGITGKVNVLDKHPELKFLRAYGYYHNLRLAGSQKKLLLVGDSFSESICQDTARYFSESLCIDAHHYLDQDLLADQPPLETILNVYQPDYIIFEGHLISTLGNLHKYLYR